MHTLMKTNVRSLFCLCVVRADAFGISEFRYSGTGPASVSPKARLIHDHTKNTVFGFLNAVFLCYFRFNSPK